MRWDTAVVTTGDDGIGGVPLEPREVQRPPGQHRHHIKAEKKEQRMGWT